MKRKKLTAAFMIWLWGASFCLGQNKDDIITIKVHSAKAELKRGEPNLISLEINIKAPYHINSNKPVEDFIVPTTITFKAEKGWTYTDPVFPEAKPKIFRFSPAPLPVYEGTIIVTTSITIPSSSKEKEVTISGILRYQACDENLCLAPVDLPFNWKFPVAEETGTVYPGEQAELKQDQKDETLFGKRASEEGDFARIVREKGLGLTFLLIFLGGLALNLTPCVYPLIPITIGYFVKQEQGRKGGVVINAVLYVLGMGFTYSTLGVIASLTGSLFGAALQKPLVLVGIALVLIILSLSMFNLFEFRLPSSLTNLAGRSKEGYFGSLFIGLTAGIVAAPCIGPFVLGLLIYIGQKGNVLLGFLMFFVLALGLGLPFLFLAIFSGSINKLPRSSAWMIWVRTIFGFILIALAIYFLGPLFPNALFYNLAIALTFLIGGIYLAWIEPTRLQGRVFLIIRNIVGLLFFVVALFFAGSGVQSYLNESMKPAFMEARFLAQKESISWSLFSEDRLREAAEMSRPVFLDFYADWCLPCKEMDRTTFVNRKVVELSQNFVMLKVDMTRSANPLVKKLQKKFSLKGVPTYIFLKPDGTEISELRTVGYLEADKLIAKMKKAIELSRN